MVLLGRIELPTSALPRMRSTTELQQPTIRTTQGRPTGPVRAGARYWRCPLALSSMRLLAQQGMGKDTAPSREERLAAKLRENLLRRKHQARELAAEAKPPLPKTDDAR